MPAGETIPVVIIGMGPIGALAGNLLGKMGIEALILEKSQEINLEPRAVHLDDISMRIFRLAGLAKEIEAIVEPMEDCAFLDKDGRELWKVLAPARTRNGFARSSMFYQPDLEAGLRKGLERYPRVQVQSGVEILNFKDQEDGTYTLTYKTPDSDRSKTIQTNFILGCDGARSFTRKQMDVELEDLGFNQSWLVADLHIQKGSETPPGVRQYCDPLRPTSFVPSSGKNRRFEFMLLENESKAEMLEPKKIHKLIDARMNLPGSKIFRATTYTFHSLIAKQWRKDGIFLLGDAAHQTPPFLGQGLNQGVRDAADLTWKLRMALENRAGAKLLDSYQSEQRPRTEKVIRLAMMLGSLIQSTSAIKAFLSRAFFRVLTALPFLSRILEKDMEQIPPSGMGFHQKKPDQIIGELFPAGLVQDLHGIQSQLDDILGNDFAVLALSAEDLQANPDELRFLEDELQAHTFILQNVPLPDANHNVLVDPTGELLEWFRKNQIRTVLIRPDRSVFGTGSLNALARSARVLLGERRPELVSA